MSVFGKGIEKAEVRLKWDPAPYGSDPHDLDLVIAVFKADDPHGAPAQLVHFGRRSPDGTVILNRDSRDGKGLGWDEVMTVELFRMAEANGRVVVGVAAQQTDGRLSFAQVAAPRVQIVAGYEVLAEEDFASLGAATAATVGEFVRDAAGLWSFRPLLRGFDADPETFAETMGSA
ncbi:TerD family protein [Streptomyces huiliensis]|uniref:TerD family protein n=1 Tax=Streptomyces huiliensis TaxID=2876027 RepID=UPI001CBAB8F4|nr:TerD family protein [Streptomyces huiliensis]MBZ4324337.1 TerD family protein [Streptomyces huiliensis]